MLILNRAATFTSMNFASGIPVLFGFAMYVAQLLILYIRDLHPNVFIKILTAKLTEGIPEGQQQHLQIGQWLEGYPSW
jgi:hypothetical protein